MAEGEEGTRTVEQQYKELTANFASRRPRNSCIHSIHIKQSIQGDENIQAQEVKVSPSAEAASKDL